MLSIPEELLKLYSVSAKKVVAFNDMGKRYKYADVVITPRYCPGILCDTQGSGI
jgi:hypothetical protein